MGEVTTVFSDVGGVILSNGWDRAARRRAVERFQLDCEDFEDRHELLLNAFETGRANLDEYVNRTVFYRPRPFSREEFKAFIFEQSQAYPETLEVLGRVASSRRCFLASLNNESRELNEYRIERFRLRDYFTAFFSSCYLGIRKPDAGIYRLALSITHCKASECIFIDDRKLNLECARELGMKTIHFGNAAKLERELGRYGVELGGA